MTKPTIVPQKVAATFKSYPAQGTPWVYDKTGAQYIVKIGNLNNTAPWGYYLFRVPQGGKPEQLFFVAGSNGDLIVINRKLYIRYCDNDWIQWTAEVPGYIDPDDKPSSNIVNVNDAAMATYKQQVSVAQNTANQSLNTSINTRNQVQGLSSEVVTLKKQIADLQSQITSLQSQILNKKQVEDIVWSKIWDVNYLIRMGFLQGSSAIREVQDYLNDLAVYIRSITKKD